jgi:hypothetical protein
VKTFEDGSHLIGDVAAGPAPVGRSQVREPHAPIAPALARIETAAGTAGMALKVWRAIARTARQPSSPFWRDDSPRRGANVGTYAWFGGPVQEGALKIGIKDGFLTLLPERPMASTKGALIPEVGDQADGEAKTRISVEAETNRIIGIPEQELSRERKFMGRIDQGPKALVL